ncbi:unnamed protein product [Alopecurus aequalis]
MLSGSSSTAAAKTMQVFHSGSGMLNVVPVLLLVSFGFILGKIGNANFSLESYLPTFRHAESSITTTPARMQFEDFLAPRGGGLVHNMTDEELFWRASMEPRRAPHVSIVPKVAFLFLTQGALPLRPLWETFFNGRGEELYSIYVHASPGYADVAPRESVFHGRLIPSQVTSWGDMNLVDAELGRHEPARRGTAPSSPTATSASRSGARGPSGSRWTAAPPWSSSPGWGARCRKRTLTYVDWSTRGPHPRSFAGKDVTAELLEGMRRGNGKCGYKFCNMFARKFSNDTLAKLIELTPKLWLL